MDYFVAEMNGYAPSAQKQLVQQLIPSNQQF